MKSLNGRMDGLTDKEVEERLTPYGKNRLTNLNFSLLVMRDGGTLANLSTTSMTYMQATTITYVTIVFCQWMNILSRRAEQDSVLSPYLWANRNLLIAYGLSLFFILNIVYNPWVSMFIGTGSLGMVDWLFALLAAGTHLTIRELWKMATRRGVLKYA